jgi:hypothetical protein
MADLFPPSIAIPPQMKMYPPPTMRERRIEIITKRVTFVG